MRTLLVGLVAPVIAGAMLLACGNGDDSSATPPASSPDASPDGSMTVIVPDGSSNPPDSSNPGGGDGGKSPDADAAAGDGACNFATFVKGLIANDTNATAQPSIDLGQGCVDDENQADFQSLFP
ncbi:MAG TPA: hypothetical protein VHV30_01065 [Polyangiaceae bacterium]|jgi:hypothetical protein|nr:hypothetical protein [Polyangiaceae bacterium]